MTRRLSTPEDDTSHAVTVSLRKSARDKLNEVARRSGKTRSAIIAEAFKAWLKANPGGPW
jgi:predicted transcriptional regulator